MIPLTHGFMPDVPPNAPGILVECSNWIPWDGGMGAAPSPAAQGSAALATGECLGAFLGEKLDGTRVVFAGTATKMYSLGGTSYTDRTHAAGDYSLTGTARWHMTQFGDNTIFCNGRGEDALQTSTGTQLTDISGAPKAHAVESVVSSGGGQVFAINTDVGQDVWIACALNDATSATAWTASAVTQCVTGRLISDDGALVAARKFGADQIVLYKQRSCYVGQYTGGTEIWSFRMIPRWGAVGKDAVANLGFAHVVVSPNDIYLFDGNRPESIAGGLRDWFFGQLSQQHMARTICTWDEDNKLVWIYYPNRTSTGAPNASLVWSPISKKWGKDDHTIEAYMLYGSSGSTWNSVTTSWNSQNYTWNATSSTTRTFSIFLTDHKLYTMTGDPEASSITIPYQGDDNMLTMLDEIRLNYKIRPSSATLSTAYSMDTGTSFTSGQTVAAYDSPTSALSRFFARQVARWHKLTFNFTGSPRVTGYAVSSLKPAGQR